MLPSAAETRPATTQRACLTDVARGTSAEIACDYPVFMTDEERADVRRLTRDYVLDARCVLTIRIARDLVERALSEPDGVFQSPPQPATCTITTSKGDVPISGTFAPRVVFKDGMAVEGMAGLANVQGVHAAIAWPVVAYVNSARSISAGIVTAVNTFIERRGQFARLE
jgi:hypothetical protein